MEKKYLIILTVLTLLAIPPLALTNAKGNPWDNVAIQINRLWAALEGNSTNLETEIQTLSDRLLRLESAPFNGAPAYDSGWKDAGGLESFLITHELNTENIHVELYGRSGEFQLPHQKYYGGYGELIPYLDHGAYWMGNDLNSILIYRGVYFEWDYVRAVIWRLPDTGLPVPEPRVTLSVWLEYLLPGFPPQTETWPLFSEVETYVYTGGILGAALGGLASTHATTGTPEYNWTLTYESDIHAPIVVVDDEGYVGLPLDKLGRWTAVLTVSGFEGDGFDPITLQYFINITP